MMDHKLNDAFAILKKECHVEPVAWTTYKGAYFIMAFPKEMKHEDRIRVLTPYYLVDLKTKMAGPFSRMVDPIGYDASVKQLQTI